MVAQEKVGMIVCTTKLKEKMIEKCKQYWPDKGQIAPVKGMTINVIGESQHLTDHLTLRTFELSDEFTGLKNFRVTQLHYEGWPDFGVPSGPSMQSFNTMLDTFIHYLLSSPNKVIVHCSAGVGRTGTLIALSQIIVSLAAQKNAEKDPRFSVFSTVRRMR